MDDILQEIKGEFKKMMDNDDWLSSYFYFEKRLLSRDTELYLDMHYAFLKSRQREALYHYLRNAFSKRKEKEQVSEFLENKLKKEKDDITIGDIIQILGKLKWKNTEKIATENINSSNPDIRYHCIIVLGWVGTLKTLEILNERMVSDIESRLRQYAATAMRQIWYNHPNTKVKITTYIKNAIEAETDKSALIGMIITIQDLYRKKLGIKESAYGDISGNVLESKEKTMKFLSKI